MTFFLSDFNGLGLLNQNIDKIVDDILPIKSRTMDEIIKERQIDNETIEKNKPDISDANLAELLNKPKPLTQYETLLDAISEKLIAEQVATNPKLPQLTKRIMTIESAIAILEKEYSENYKEMIQSISNLDINNVPELIRLNQLNQCMVAYLELLERLANKKTMRPL